MFYTILGFSRFKSKKGNMCTTLQLSRDFTDREIEAGSCGVRVEDAFLPEDCLDIAVSENIGKQCNLLYNRNGYLQAIDIVK